jgi:hypothetical protein
MTEEASNLHWIMPFEGISPFRNLSCQEKTYSNDFFGEIQRDSNKRKSRNSSLPFFLPMQISFHFN